MDFLGRFCYVLKFSGHFRAALGVILRPLKVTLGVMGTTLRTIWVHRLFQGASGHPLGSLSPHGYLAFLPSALHPVGTADVRTERLRVQVQVSGVLGRLAAHDCVCVLSVCDCEWFGNLNGLVMQITHEWPRCPSGATCAWRRAHHRAGCAKRRRAIRVPAHRVRARGAPPRRGGSRAALCTQPRTRGRIARVRGSQHKFGWRQWR